MEQRDIIPLSAPDITDAEIKKVEAVLRAGQLSQGAMVEQFELMIAERIGCDHAIAVNSGTAALHLSVLGLGLGPGDEVIVPAFGYANIVNCVLYCGATPVFVDIEPVSMNLDAHKLETAITDQTRAIIFTHTFGNPMHFDRICAMASKYEIPLIENAMDGLGTQYRQRPVGSFGRAAVFAFYPNRPITTGEGGVIVTDDDHLAENCRALRNHGRPPKLDLTHHDIASMLQHDVLGFNYRMPEIAAALGVAQLERLDAILEKRQNLACLYIDKLMDFHEIILPTLADDAQLSWFVFVIRLTDTFAQHERDRIMLGMRRHEVGCGNYYPPLHLHPYVRERFATKKGDFPVAESVAQRTIALPFFTNMEPTQVELATLTLRVMLDREKLLMQPEEESDDDDALPDRTQ